MSSRLLAAVCVHMPNSQLLRMAKGKGNVCTWPVKNTKVEHNTVRTRHSMKATSQYQETKPKPNVDGRPVHSNQGGPRFCLALQVVHPSQGGKWRHTPPRQTQSGTSAASRFEAGAAVILLWLTKLARQQV